MASGNPGCASAISSRGIGLIPGPGSMPPACANHGWRTTKGLKRVVHATVKRRGSGWMAVGRATQAKCWARW